MAAGEFTHLRTIADPIGSGDTDAVASNADIPALGSGSIGIGPREVTLEIYYDIVNAAGASQARSTMTMDVKVVRRNIVDVLRAGRRVKASHTVGSVTVTAAPRDIITITVAQCDRASILLNNPQNPVASVNVEVFYREVPKP